MSRASFVSSWWRALASALRSRPRRPARPPRPYLELLEARLAPATATYNAGLFVLNGRPAANKVTVSTPADNSVQIVLGFGDTFTSSPVGAAFVLSNGNRTLTVNTSAGQAPMTTFQVNLGNSADSLVFGLSAAAT